MMKKIHLFFSFLMALAIFNTGCNNEPVTLATSADGVEINFSNQGQGEPAIILIHGWTNNNTIWDSQIPALSEKYQVIAVDLAGHGKSGSQRKEWTMAAYGQDIAAVVEAAKLKDVILVGFSMGSAVAFEAAKLLPDQAKGVILVDAIHDPEEITPPQVFHFVDSLFMDLINEPTAEKAMALGFFVKNPEESIAKIKAMIERDGRGWQSSLAEFVNWRNEDCIDALTGFDIPLRSINATYRPTAEDNFRKYVSSYGAKYVSGTGHVLMWDAPEEFSKLLLESIDEIIAEE